MRNRRRRIERAAQNNNMNGLKARLVKVCLTFFSHGGKLLNRLLCCHGTSSFNCDNIHLNASVEDMILRELFAALNFLDLTPSFYQENFDVHNFLLLSTIIFFFMSFQRSWIACTLCNELVHLLSVHKCLKLIFQPDVLRFQYRTV